MSSRASVRGSPLNINGWHLETYWISATDRPAQIDNARVETLVSKCESNFDPDYQYQKKGFLIWHRGRRGNMLSLWHTGYWGDTKEVFQYSQYWLHSDPETLEVLTSKDPILSSYDIDTVIHILKEMQEF